MSSAPHSRQRQSRMPEHDHNDLAFDALHDVYELDEIGRMLRNEPRRENPTLRWAEWEEYELNIHQNRRTT